MKQRNKLITILLSVVLGLSILIMANWSWRWIVIYGWEAANFAGELLEGGNPSTNESFIDYTIYTAHGCVVFATHDSDRTMVYCPNGVQANIYQIGHVEHVIGPWYQME